MKRCRCITESLVMNKGGRRLFISKQVRLERSCLDIGKPGAKEPWRNQYYDDERDALAVGERPQGELSCARCAHKFKCLFDYLASAHYEEVEG